MRRFLECYEEEQANGPVKVVAIEDITGWEPERVRDLVRDQRDLKRMCAIIYEHDDDNLACARGIVNALIITAICVAVGGLLLWIF